MNGTPRPSYQVVLAGEAHACRAVRGREAVSEPYRFEVDLARDADDAGALADPDALIGEPARLVLRDDERGELRSWSAVITEAARDLLVAGTAEVSLVLEPRLALLRHRRDLRSFLDRDAISIVEEVLLGAGLTVHRRLSRAYRPRDYTVEWRESDLDFAARLLEDEGVFYLVAPDGAVILGDGPAAWDELPGHLVYGEAEGLETSRSDGEALFDLEVEATLGPSHVLLRDFDFERPRFDLRGEADVPASLFAPSAPPRRVLYDFPAELLGGVDPAEKARLVAEELAAASGHARARSFEPTLAPGAVSTWVRTPDDVPEGRYALLALEHDFDAERGGFAVALTALPAAQPYRPPRLTPVPAISSPLTAHVVGPEDIHTDAWGRVRLHFPWDRARPRADATTAWVPDIQDNTGHSVAIVRRGWEVLVHFAEGDPDRPVILGRLYNGADPPPDKLPENKVRSRVQTQVSPSRVGFNRVDFDDRAGAEMWSLRAERDHTITVANDRRSSVLSDETWHVQHDESLTVGRDRRTQIGATANREVKGDRADAIAGERRLDVGGSITSGTGGDATLTTPVHLRRVGTHEGSTAGRLFETVGGVDLAVARADHGTDVAGPLVHAVGGGQVDVAGGRHVTRTGGARAEVVGGLAFATAGENVAISAGAARKIHVGGSLTVQAGTTLDVTAGPSFTAQAAEGSLSFPDGITLKVGDTVVVIADGKVGFSGCPEIRVTLDGEAHFAAPKVAQGGGS